MLNKNFLILYKVIFATLCLYAVAQENITLILRGTYDFVNYWSYFTNLSNLFAGVMLLVSAYVLWRRVKSKNLDLFRGASTLYMVITGVVFAVLLSGADPSELTAVPIDNTIMHQIIPVAMLVDWIINPPKKRISFVRSLWWLAFPLGYVFISLIRGALTDWYPYDFLDPAVGGYQAVFITVGGIVVFVLIMAWLMTRLPLKPKKK